MKRKSLTALLSVFLFFLLPAAFPILTASAGAGEKTYQIATVPWAGWSPAHVAEVHGFWEDSGLSVEVVNCDSTQQMYTLFKSRRVDILFDMIGSAIGLYMDGLDVTIIAETNWSHGGDKIILKKGAAADQLKGRPVGVYLKVPSVSFFLNKFLQPHGLSLSDVTLVEMEPSILADEFIAQRLDLIVSYDPDALRAERDGQGLVAATSADFRGCIPEGMIMLQEVYSNSDQDELARIIKGWVKATQWTLDPDHREDFFNILNEITYKDGRFPQEDLQAMLSAVKIHTPEELVHRNGPGGGLENYLQEMKAFLSENDLLERDFSPGDVFDNSVVMKALK